MMDPLLEIHTLILFLIIDSNYMIGIQFLFHIFSFLEHDFRFGWITLRFLALETLAFMDRA